MSIGELDDGDQSSIAEMSFDFSVYSDGISSIAADSAISQNINNISNHAVAPILLRDNISTTSRANRSPDPPANSNPYLYTYDPYASVVDSDSGASPSLHLGSENGVRLGGDAPDPPSGTEGMEMIKRLSTRFADLRAVKDKPRPEESPPDASINKHAKSKSKNTKGKCVSFPMWLADAPPLIQFVLLLSAALLVGAVVMLFVIVIGTAAKKRTNPSQDFTPMGGEEGDILGVIPSASHETLEPSLEPTLEPTAEPTTEVPPTLFGTVPDVGGVTSLPSIFIEEQSGMPSQLPTTYLYASCQDSLEPFSYIHKSGIVQSIASCDELSADFRFFILGDICGLDVIGMPASDGTLVSDLCPRTCNACGATKSPSSAPSSSIDTPTDIPSPPPSIDESMAVSNRPTNTKSMFFITGGHFKRSDDIGPLLRALPSDDGAVLIHLGDMNRPQWRDCDKKSWQIVLDIWLASSIPLFAVPGEDDWTHCDDPDDGLELWEEYLMGIGQCCWNDYVGAGTVARQEETAGNWAFVQNRVLHVGLHLVSGPDIPNMKKWINRLNADMEWLLDNASTSGDSVEVICVFGHSDVNDEANREFFESFAAAADVWNVPVLYFHQDDETEYPWTYERNLFGVNNFLRVGIREKLWPPLRVVVDTAANTFNLDNESWHVGLVGNGGSIFDGNLQAMDGGQ